MSNRIGAKYEKLWKFISNILRYKKVAKSYLKSTGSDDTHTWTLTMLIY